jgi:hypothetical protein
VGEVVPVADEQAEFVQLEALKDVQDDTDKLRVDIVKL